jgi:hypothetical protein
MDSLSQCQDCSDPYRAHTDRCIETPTNAKFHIYYNP